MPNSLESGNSPLDYHVAAQPEASAYGSLMESAFYHSVLISRWLALLACCALLGCSRVDKGPERGAVRGRVTVDGQPVEQGSIRFTPVQGTKGAVSGAAIENGEYSVSKAMGPVVGTNLVQITGSRKTGKKITDRLGIMVDERVPMVPEHYNSQSTLIRQVEPGKQVFDFELSSN